MSDDKAENYGDCVYKRYSMWGNQFGQLIDGSKTQKQQKKNIERRTKINDCMFRGVGRWATMFVYVY